MGQMSRGCSFTKDLQDLWSEIQAQYGRVFAPENKRFIEDYICDTLEVKRCDLEGDPELQEDFRGCFQDWVPLLAQCMGTPNSQVNNTAGGKVKLKSLERRLYIFNYVTSRLNADSITPEGRLRKGTGERIAAEWNRNHPSDKMTAATLRREWNRVKADPNVQFNLEVGRFLAEFDHIGPTVRERLIQRLQEIGDSTDMTEEAKASAMKQGITKAASQLDAAVNALEELLEEAGEGINRQSL